MPPVETALAALAATLVPRSPCPVQVRTATHAVADAWMIDRPITTEFFSAIAEVFRSVERTERDPVRRHVLSERRYEALIAAVEATAAYRTAVGAGDAPSRDVWRPDGRGGPR